MCWFGVRWSGEWAVRRKTNKAGLGTSLRRIVNAMIEIVCNRVIRVYIADKFDSPHLQKTPTMAMMAEVEDYDRIQF